MMPHIEEKRAIAICKLALMTSQAHAAQRYGITKQAVQKLFRCRRTTIFLDHELFDRDGKAKSFKELQIIYREFISSIGGV